MLKKLFNKVIRNQKGITGLETAIILIAFVVVASVFAYTVLSAGIFSSEKGKEAVYSGLEQARASIVNKGEIVAMATDAAPDTDVDQLVMTLTNALGGEAIDMTAPTDADTDGVADTGSNNVTVISYTDITQRVEDLDWSVTPLGNDDGDDLLEPGETFELTIDLGAMDTDIVAYTNFSIEVKPIKGSVLVLEFTCPATIDPVMILK